MNKKTYALIIFMLLSIAGITGKAFAQNKKDALKLYRTGRTLDANGRTEDAKKMYNEAITICQSELKSNPKNLDSYTVYTWSLFRLHLYRDTVNMCKKALKIAADSRIIETMAEAYFYLNNYNESLRYMEKYISMNPLGERISVAYFYVGDIYRLTKRYQKADIAYSAALHLNPGNSLWWYRLGLTREHAGEKQTAIDAYKKAIKIRKKYPDAEKGLKRLEA